MSLEAYLLWRIAAARFGRRPWQLCAEEMGAAKAQAAREQRVIDCALASPEAETVQADADVVGAAVAAQAQGFADRATFVAELRQSGLDEEAFTRAVADELRAGRVLECIGAGAVVSESEVRAWFERNRTRLVVPERRVASHILLTVTEGSAEGSAERVRERLAELAGAIAEGADFAAVALRHSECPTALKGGVVGEVRRGQLYPELDAALFSLGVGESALAASPLGWHLVRCDAVISPSPLDYEAAAPAIRKKLESVARERLLKAWLAAAGRERRHSA